MNERGDVCLFSRKRLEMTGVEEVVSLSEEEIVLTSSMGKVSVEGRGMKIESFSTESGELKINGEFDGFYYYGEKNDGTKRGLFGKLFK